MNPDDRKSFFFIFRIPVPQLRDYVLAVDSAKGPEFDQNYAILKLIQRQRTAVDPRPSGDIRRRLAGGKSPTRASWDIPNAQRYYKNKEQVKPVQHRNIFLSFSSLSQWPFTRD